MKARNKKEIKKNDLKQFYKRITTKIKCKSKTIIKTIIKNKMDSKKLMCVTKRDGSEETVSFDKVSNRLKNLIELVDHEKLSSIDYISLAQKVCSDIYSGVKTSELDELAAQMCAALITENGEYGVLAQRLAISNHQKKTSPSFSEVVENLRRSKNSRGETVSIITEDFYNIVMKNKEKINQVIDYNRDYLIDYFGFKTLEKSYLLKSDGNIVERPQHLFMRVAIDIHGNDFKDAINCYHYLSQKKCIHATPTLFNAGTKGGQLASCFLLGINEDSIHGIYDALKETALISKNAGGIGIHIHTVRGRGSLIGGGTGHSNGLVPMLRVFNNTAKYVDQGGGKRNGSFAIYIEPWHRDIDEFLELKKNHGNEESRARDLFYALWIPDLFMERVKNCETWTLMCPDEFPGLSDVYGNEFKELYESYEKKARKNNRGHVVAAQELWFKILESQVETGGPYMLYKDACNEKSNQKNLGTIKSSNLCTEIIQYSGKDETAVCNLASISLPSFVIANKELKNKKIKIASKEDCIYCKMTESYCKEWNFEYEVVYDEIHKNYPQIYVEQTLIGGYTEFLNSYRPDYDYEELENTARILTKNLNKVIDKTSYPIPSAEKSNKKHRPIGIGVQGLADVFFLMKTPFESKFARQLNTNIFETIYFGALSESVKICKKREEWIKNEDYDNLHLTIEEMKKVENKEKYVGSYSSFNGSPLQKGLFQFDLWTQREMNTTIHEVWTKTRYDWEGLRKDVVTHGARNSLLVSPMPTASTAQILGNNECFEAVTSNIYVRRTLAGEFVLVNKHLQKELTSLSLWNENVKNQILVDEGSVQNIQSIPKCIREVYKTVWEISQKTVIDLAIDRSHFICQSQSMNLFTTDPKFNSLSSMHFYGWKNGLKTGMYYLRTKPKSKTQTFTLDVKNDDVCESCSG
jgi:ribonucleoside-diphosphate reductase subunit M1